MISTSEFKKGVRILVDGDPYEVMDYTVSTPTARGSATLVRTKIRNLLTGAVFDRTYKSGEKFEPPDMQLRPVQFLYRDGSDCHFMDTESYDQFHIPDEKLGDQAHWLTDGAMVRSVIFNGSVAGIELPQFMEFEIAETEPAVRGDTASGRVMKDATLATGAIVKVPLYMDAGERILVATATGEFVKRITTK